MEYSLPNRLILFPHAGFRDYLKPAGRLNPSTRNPQIYGFGVTRSSVTRGLWRGLFRRHFMTRG